MAITHTHALALTVAGVRLSDTSVDVSGGSEKRIDESVSNGATDLEIAFTCDQSELESFIMLSDKALTVKTNDSSMPDDTFTLVANQPVAWNSLNGTTCPITADVTSIFVTNASGASARLQIWSLEDPTP